MNNETHIQKLRESREKKKREQKNAAVRKHDEANPLKNSWRVYNYKRKKVGKEKIDFETYCAIRRGFIKQNTRARNPVKEIESLDERRIDREEKRELRSEKRLLREQQSNQYRESGDVIGRLMGENYDL